MGTAAPRDDRVDSRDRLRGLHAYEGHVIGDLAARRRAAAPIHDRVCSIVRRLRAAGLVVGELVTSGTPGLTPALEHEGLRSLPGTRHRVSPGTVVIAPVASQKAFHPDGLPSTSDCTYCSFVLRL